MFDNPENLNLSPSLPGSDNLSPIYGFDNFNRIDHSSHPIGPSGLNDGEMHQQIYLITVTDLSTAKLYDELVEHQQFSGVMLTKQNSIYDAITGLEEFIGNSSLQNLHIFSHGAPGSLAIGGTTINNSNIKHFTNELNQLGKLIDGPGDLLLHGCSLGAGHEGREFIDMIADATKVDVGASDDIAGVNPLSQCSDWNLEVVHGHINYDPHVLENLNWTGSLNADSHSQHTSFPDSNSTYYADVGPSIATLTCQNKVFTSGVENNYLGIDQPETIDLDLPIDSQGSAFQDVKLKILDPGTVTPRWTSGTDQASVVDRGTALYWIPDNAEKDSARVLFVHGGSWVSGSPWSAGYATFAAKLAKRLKMPVLSIDYTLVPEGDFNLIQNQIGTATKFMGKYDPWRLLRNKKNSKSKESVPLYIVGDSSGGGSALSALVAQSSPSGLKGAGKFKLSGGNLFSPWINLESNSPTYQSNLYGYISDGNYRVGDILFGKGDLENNVIDFQATARNYLGKNSGIPLNDPIANPFYAKKKWLKNLPPVSIHMGQAETLLSDGSIMSQKIAAAGSTAVFHQYDGMWHDFQMYEDGCGCGESLLFAESAYDATAHFLNGLSKGKAFPDINTPIIFNHYEYPQRNDTAAGLTPFSN